MHMPIYQPRAKISAVGVHFLLPGVAAYAQNDPIPDGYVCCFNGFGKNIDHPGILDDQGCIAAGRIENGIS